MTSTPSASSSTGGASMSDLENLQNQAQQQYLSESENEVQQEMASQQAQMAKAAAEAWAKAQ